MIKNMVKFWLSRTFYLKNNFLLLPKWPKYTVFIFHDILPATDSIFSISFVRWTICWRYTLLPPIDRIQLGNFAFVVHVFLIYLKTNFLQLGHFGSELKYIFPGSPHRACVGTRRERFEVGNLSAPISPLLLACADGATTLSLYWILGLGVNGY